MERYRLKADMLGHAAGDEFVRCDLPDYGLRRDHEAITGERHINLSVDGEYPFICVPMSAVEAASPQMQGRAGT